jgi:hypothetical protein
MANALMVSANNARGITLLHNEYRFDGGYYLLVLK